MWMAHRLASSRSTTKYASAASCRVKLVHTWKHILYHPTSRAISWTKCEKGSLWIWRSIHFWNQQISQRATISSQYLWCFLPLLAFRNSFWGALPPVVGLSFLWAGSSLSDIDGPTSTAIWANCQVGNDSGDLPTSPNFSASAILPSVSFGVIRPSILGTRGSWHWGFLRMGMHLCPHFHFLWLPLLPLPQCNLYSSHTGKENQPIRSQSSFARVTWHLFWIH